MASKRPCLLLAGILLAAGCLSEGEMASGPLPFDPIPAPEWEPGFSWHYKVTTKQILSGGQSKAPQTETGKVIVRVMNTTGSVDGEPVYFLRVDGDEMEIPFWSDDLVAVTQDQLEEVASGGFARPTPAPAPRSNCTPVSGPFLRTHAPNTFPGPRFPLDDGQTWNGSVAPGDGPKMAFKSTVLGLEAIDVPAGRFASAHVRVQVDARQATPAASKAGLAEPAFTVLGDLWYSPEARNLAKAVVRIQVTQLFPHASSMTFEQTLELDTYTRAVRPAEPAPIVQEPQEGSYRLRILSDSPLPLELGDQGKRVRFGFEATPLKPTAPDDEMRSLQLWRPQSPVEQGVLQVAEYDRTLFEPEWTITGADLWLHQVRSEVLEITLTDAAAYLVSVSLRPKTCGDASGGSASGYAIAFQERTYSVEPPAGADFREISVTNLVTKANGMNVSAHWSWVEPQDDALERTLHGLPLRDDGRPVLRRGGDEMPGTGSGSLVFTSLPRGSYQLHWQPEGGDTGYGRAPVLLGQELVLTVRLMPPPPSEFYFAL